MIRQSVAPLDLPPSLVFAPNLRTYPNFSETQQIVIPSIGFPLWSWRWVRLGSFTVKGTLRSISRQPPRQATATLTHCIFALTTFLLLGSGFALPLTTVEQQEVAQQILALPVNSHAVREGHLFALTWLGDRNGLHEALKGPQPAALQNLPAPSPSQLIPVALKVGHPELLEEFQPLTQQDWGPLVQNLASGGFYELADRWLKRIPVDAQPAAHYVEAAVGTFGSGTTPPAARQWAAKWASQAEAGLGQLPGAEVQRSRYLLTATYARLHDLSGLERMLASLTSKERKQRLGELVLEASMSDPAFASLLLQRMQPQNAQDYGRQALLWSTLGNNAEILKQLVQIPISKDKDGLLSNIALQQVAAGHLEFLPKYLASIQSPEMRVGTTADVALQLVQRGQSELAAKYAQQAHDLAQTHHLDSANLRLTLLQAYGATGRSADAQKLLQRVGQEPQLRIAYLTGLVAGDRMEQALRQAALIHTSEHLHPEGFLTSFEMLLQRQHYAQLRSLLAILKPVLLAQTTLEGKIVRGSYFSYLIRSGAPDALKDLRPNEDVGALLYDASTSGRLDLLPTLLAQAADPQGELAGINEGVAALGLIHNGYSEKALTLFHQSKVPEAKALIGTMLLSNEEPKNVVSR